MEVINSFFSNIKDKLTNPFFGTLILVLIVNHWELIYAIFNFDSNFTLDEKLLFIQDYVSENITIGSLGVDFLYAFAYMAVGYLIVVVTRSLVLAVEFRLMPFITGKIISKNVVEKSLYDEVVKEREDYFDQYEEQRKNVRDFSKTIDEQTEQIKEKDKNFLEQNQTASRTAKDLANLNNALNSITVSLADTKKELEIKNKEFDSLTEKYKYLADRVVKFENLYFHSKNVGYYTATDNFPPEITEKVFELKIEDLWGDFIALGDFKGNGGSLSGETMTKMVEKGIIVERLKHEEWTPVGEIINKYRNIFEEPSGNILLVT